MALPHVLRFLTGFTEGRMEPYYTMNQYMAFLIKLSLAFGLVFELPVVSFVLTRLGLITPRFLVTKAKYAIEAVFITSAVLTPPDVLSQLLLAVPLLLLYGVSILVSLVVVRKRA
jgi:sec-independent protein translocase protein TatC